MNAEIYDNLTESDIMADIKIIILANNEREANYYCDYIADPPIRPSFKNVITIVRPTDLYKLLGLRLMPENCRVIVFNSYSLRGGFYKKFTDNIESRGFLLKEIETVGE